MAPGDMVLLSLDGLHTAVGRVTIHDMGRDWVTVASRKAVLVERYEQQWREMQGQGQQGGQQTDRGQQVREQQGQGQQGWEQQGVWRGQQMHFAGGGTLQQQPWQQSQGARQQGQRSHQRQQQQQHALASSSPSSSLACWRLDKDEVASLSVTLRTNLMRLVSDANSARAARLRSLIIDLSPPRMHSLADPVGDAAGGPGSTQEAGGAGGEQHASACSTPGAGTGLRLRLRLEAAERYLRSPEGRGLNDEQATAVRKVAGAEDYALVLGMPGEWMGGWALLFMLIFEHVACRGHESSGCSLGMCMLHCSVVAKPAVHKPYCFDGIGKAYCPLQPTVCPLFVLCCCPWLLYVVRHWEDQHNCSSHQHAGGSWCQCAGQRLHQQRRGQHPGQTGQTQGEGLRGQPTWCEVQASGCRGHLTGGSAVGLV